MKKLKLNFQYLQNAEVLTRSQMKKVLGGDPPTSGGGDIRCNTFCDGDQWNPQTLRYDRFTHSPCAWAPGVGDLPGSCDCLYTVDATACV